MLMEGGERTNGGSGFLCVMRGRGGLGGGEGSVRSEIAERGESDVGSVFVMDAGGGTCLGWQRGTWFGGLRR